MVSRKISFFNKIGYFFGCFLSCIPLENNGIFLSFFQSLLILYKSKICLFIALFEIFCGTTRSISKWYVSPCYNISYTSCFYYLPQKGGVRIKNLVKIGFLCYWSLETWNKNDSYL